jgi:hypothetical protein
MVFFEKQTDKKYKHMEEDWENVGFVQQIIKTTYEIL